MTAHLTEEEQIETFKRWWADNGSNLLITVGLVVAGYFGWQAWQNSQRAAAEAASAIYSDMFSALQVAPGETLSDEKRTTIEHLAGQLKADYSGSVYAQNAALLLAKLAVEQKDLDLAVKELQWVKDAGPDDSVELLVDLRLARVFLAQGKPEAALELIQGKADEAFSPLFAELRGDIFVHQGALAKARAAYAMALTQLGADANVQRNIIQLKLNDIKVAEPEGSDATEDAV